MHHILKALITIVIPVMIVAAIDRSLYQNEITNLEAQVQEYADMIYDEQTGFLTQISALTADNRQLHAEKVKIRNMLVDRTTKMAQVFDAEAMRLLDAEVEIGQLRGVEKSYTRFLNARLSGAN